MPANVARLCPDDIEVGQRLRAGLDEAAVRRLADSMAQIGLHTPISVRVVRGGDDASARVILVAGRTRLAAAKLLGWTHVDVVYTDGDETDARLWEIAENLHRADLTALERAEHVAEWVRITEAKQAKDAAEGLLLGADKLAQVAPVSKPAGGRGKEGGIRAASRDLGISRDQAARALKIDSIAPEAKAAAAEAGLADNQSALLKVAAEPTPEAQAEKVAEIERTKAEPKQRDEEHTVFAREVAGFLLDHIPTGAVSTLVSYIEAMDVAEVVRAIVAINRERRTHLPAA